MSDSESSGEIIDEVPEEPVPTIPPSSQNCATSDASNNDGESQQRTHTHRVSIEGVPSFGAQNTSTLPSFSGGAAEPLEAFPSMRVSDESGDAVPPLGDDSSEVSSPVLDGPIMQIGGQAPSDAVMLSRRRTDVCFSQQPEIEPSPGQSKKLSRRMNKSRMSQPEIKARSAKQKNLKTLVMNEIRLVETYPGYVRYHSDFEFVKKIGKGGFGVVWLANDLRYGQQVAVKEIIKEELVGRALKSFCREIETHAASTDPFVCPFVGFTIEPPYSIITKYMPGGTMRQKSVEVKKMGGVISGTEQTVIAMCVAHAIWKIHQAGIVHRDIKASNVLLDEAGMPYLTDFGIARFLVEKRKMSMNLGTLSHLAPEVLQTDDYTQKVDVYGYGMFLYEMAHHRLPFGGGKLPSKVLAEKITAGERPKVAPGLPKALVQLITSCWAQNPNERPNMCEIFMKFADGSVSFKGTKQSKVKALARQIMADDAMRLVNPPKPPEPSVDVDAILTRLRRRMSKRGPMKKKRVGRRPSIVTNVNLEIIPNISRNSLPDGAKVETIEFPPLTEKSEILANPKNPYFFSYIDYLCRHIQLSQFETLYEQLVPYILRVDEGTLTILNSLSQLINVDQKFLYTFCDERLFSSLPLSHEFDQINFLLFSSLMVFAPERVNQQMFRILAYFLKYRPEDTLCLFVYYAKKIDRIDDPFPTLDVFLSYARTFMDSPSGAMFIDVIFYLLIDYDEFHEARIKVIRPILSAFVKSPIKEVAVRAMSAICRLWSSEFRIPMKTLVSYLEVPELVEPALSLLKLVSPYPLAQVLVKALSAVPKTPSSYLVLLKFVVQEGADKLFLSTDVWMETSDPEQVPLAFRLFLYLFTAPENRDKLASKKRFATLMTHATAMQDAAILQGIAVVFRRLTYTPELTANLCSAGFYAELAAAAEVNQTLYQSAFLVIDKLCHSGFDIGYAVFLPLLFKTLPLRNNVTVAGINMLATLSAHSELHQYLADPAIVNYFEQLAAINQDNVTARTFLDNIRSTKCKE